MTKILDFIVGIFTNDRYIVKMTRKDYSYGGLGNLNSFTHYQIASDNFLDWMVSTYEELGYKVEVIGREPLTKAIREVKNLNEKNIEDLIERNRGE